MSTAIFLVSNINSEIFLKEVTRYIDDYGYSFDNIKFSTAVGVDGQLVYSAIGLRSNK